MSGLRHGWCKEPSCGLVVYADGRGDSSHDGMERRTEWGVASRSYSNDMHSYSVALRAWTDLSSPASGSPPAGRQGHGMTAWEGVIYIFGGRPGISASGCTALC
eukprot:3814932-Rhodomonas_salina.1